MPKIELLSPAGSLANLKAAVSRGADAIYLGMNKFSARAYATNFNENYLKEAVNICKSNDVKIYLAMNTLVKNNEINDFFKQLSSAYEKGIDAIILQETSFMDTIRKNFPDLKIHISTQAGVMNSPHANLLKDADRITLAREIRFEEIKNIRKNYEKELEIFCHGALCVSISGQCLFSSFLGGRSGNRGRCAQPCRKKYNNEYFLSTKELSLINDIPEIINAGINSLKIEGRMRTPYYVATVTEIYRKAIDSFYDNEFKITKEIERKLESAFSRDFTRGVYAGEGVFNRKKATGDINLIKKETYEVDFKDHKSNRKKISPILPEIKEKPSQKKRLLVRVYNQNDAISASESGADIIYYDIYKKDFKETKEKISCKLYAVTPRIMLDPDIDEVKDLIEKNQPDGILAGNQGILNLNINLPIHREYNLNTFNDLDILNAEKNDAFPIISPELSVTELSFLKSKNFVSLVHGKIRMMTLRHELPKGIIRDEKGGTFIVNKIHNGSEILNEKELGLLSKSQHLLKSGINNFFIDTENDVAEMVKFYRNILDGKKVSDEQLKKKYVLGWAFRGVE